jgi:hypothetical protein
MTSPAQIASSHQIRWLASSLFLASCIVVLFLGFYRNQWGVVREKRFKEFQLDSESLVIARMVESRHRGILSQNGLLGWGDADPSNLNQGDYDHQYDVFLSDGTFRTYSLYKSASGAQAFLFSALRLSSPFSPALDLRNFRAMVALLLALVLSSFVAWALYEFGWATAVVLVVSTALSQWITLFGRNLFYFIWASFLPLALTAGYLAWRSRRGGRISPGLAAVVFGSVLFKCLANGYDFIIPALSMPVVPFVYYAVRDRWPRRLLITNALALLAGIAAAVAISLAVLALQLQVSEGSFVGGVYSILSTFSRRTYADPELFPAYAESLRANPWAVVWTYVSEDSAIWILGVRFLDLILVTAGMTVFYLAAAAIRPRQFTHTAKSNGLIAATWLSLLSPLTWFFLFKGQAYVHTHTNYLAWHMPFALFAYMLCAWLLERLVKALRRGTGSPRVRDQDSRS